jgi:iron complex outermembrane receptor protein
MLQGVRLVVFFAVASFAAAATLGGGAATAQEVEVEAEIREDQELGAGVAEEVVEDEAGVPGDTDAASIDELGEDDIKAIDEDLSGPGIEEITVTATKREESLQNVPISVSVLSASFIEDAGITEFSQLQNFVPNLTIAPVTDSRSTSVMIRGIGSVGSNAGIDPAVGIFIDGVYQGRAGMSVQDLLDIQGIEILRGPQGTLYGKNTAAGAIKIETKDPSYEPELGLEFVGGNYMDIEGRLMNIEGRFSGNFPIVDEVLATRLSGYVVSRDGYETNRGAKFDGDNVNDAEKWGLRNKTLWDITDDWHLLISADHSAQGQTGFIPEVKDYSCKPVAFDNACEAAANQGIELDKRSDNTADFKDRDVYTDVKPQNDVTTSGVAIELTHERWDHEFTSLTSYRHYTSDSFWDGDFSEIDATTWDTEVELDQVSSELRAASPAWDLWDYVTGFYFYYSDMQTDDTLGQTEAYWEPFFGAGNGGQRTIADNNHKTTSAAGYADASFNLGELWGNAPDITLTSGLRVGWERKGIDGSHRCEGPICVINTPIGGDDVDLNEHTDDTYVTFREVLKYEPVENIMLYASYATGYKSGGYNQLRQNAGLGEDEDDVDRYFNPEESKSWEAGVKTSWLDRMVTWNVAGFYTDYKDFQVVVSDGLIIKTQNAKGFYSTGFETDLTIVPIEGWITVFGAGFVKTKYDDYEDGPCTAKQLRDAGGFVCEQDLTGERRAGAPSLNLTLFSAYERNLPWWDIDWFAQLDYNYMSKRYLETDLDKNLLTDRTHLLGLRAGLRHPEMKWELAAWMKNVTDETFQAAGFDIPVLGGYAVVIGPPRTVGVTARMNF